MFREYVCACVCLHTWINACMSCRLRVCAHTQACVHIHAYCMCVSADNNQMKVSNNVLYAAKQSSSPSFYANSVRFDCMLNKQQVFGNKLCELNGSKERERSSRLVSRDLQREGWKSKKDGGRESGIWRNTRGTLHRKDKEEKRRWR